MLPKEQTEQELALMYSLLDSCPAAAWMRDPEGTHVYLNGQARQFGVQKGDRLKDVGPRGFTSSMIARAFKDDQAVLESGQPLVRDVEVPTASGDYACLRAVKYLVSDPSGKFFVGAIAIDVTDLSERIKALESELDSLRKKAA